MNTEKVVRSNAFSTRMGTRDMAVMAMFTAIIMIMAFTPFGIIDLPLIKATILHVPVIIGSIVLGPKKGAFFGFLFGLTSFIKNTTGPSLLSFAFTPVVPVPGLGHGSMWSVVICFLPRILVGVVPYYAHRAALKLAGGRMSLPVHTAVLAVCGALGAIVNTGLVMGMIYVVFKDAYALSRGIPVDEVLAVILGIVGANGVPEMIAAAVIVPFVVIALIRAKVVNVKQSCGYCSRADQPPMTESKPYK